MKDAFRTNDYFYDLPEDRIAKFPLENRSDSKLLVYKKEKIQSDSFENIIDHLSSNSFLLFNDTKVIEARLHFFKDTGARIEIFLLNPEAPNKEIAVAMAAKQQCSWICTIGNKKKWKNNSILELPLSVDGAQIVLKARLIRNDENEVLFTWGTDHSFADILHYAGKIPIPPYLHREKQLIDEERYQTVYSNHKGAVAAPTAGLHFTDQLIDNLKVNNVKTGYATLHVSASTFKPIQEEDFRHHDMHEEQIVMTVETLKELIHHDNIICVGTTSLRILESVYWMGVQLLLNENNPFYVDKSYPYKIQDIDLPNAKIALKAIVNHLEEQGVDHIYGQTQIFIYPGYSFKLCKGLITNFHMPKSTLLLLISALIGDKWKEVYDFALANNYRFLSYGDSSLLIP